MHIRAPAAQDADIELGDLLWQDDAGHAWPASDFAWAGNELATLVGFHDRFLGVAKSVSPAGVANEVKVAVHTVETFECAEQIYKLGQLIQANVNINGDSLDDQTADPNSSDPAIAIGRSVSHAATPQNTIDVLITSSIILGGPQPVA